MTIQEHSVFEPLPMRREELIPVSANQYRITDSAGNVLEVEADTAYEAFHRSGLQGANKIERLVNIKHIIVTKELFVHNKIPQEKVEPVNLRQETLMNLKRRSTPVISAAELGHLMEILRGTDPLPLTTTSGAHDTGIVKKAEGEGFDEIIPQATSGKAISPVKHSSAQEAPATDMENTSQEDIPPAQELSQEEIDKLLNS